MTLGKDGLVDRSTIPDCMGQIGRWCLINDKDKEFVAILDGFLATLSRLQDGRIRDKQERERRVN